MAFDGRISSANSELDRIKDQMTRFDERLAASEQRWREQFTRLETMLNQSQTQSSWLSGQLAALPRP